MKASFVVSAGCMHRLIVADLETFGRRGMFVVVKSVSTLNGGISS